MRYTLHVEEGFEAAHWLPGHPKCGACHGHSYRVEVFVGGFRLNNNGMLLDFGEIKPEVRKLVGELDHKTLNDYFETPTAENIARHFWDELCEAEIAVQRVVVWETATAYAEISAPIPLEWIAGFLEGDGSFTYRLYKTSHGRYSAQPMIVITQNERAVLERIQQTLKTFHISSTIVAQRKCLNLKVCGYKGCRRLARRLAGFLFSDKKRKQFQMFYKVFGIGTKAVRGKFVGADYDEAKKLLQQAGWISTRWKGEQL